MTNQAKQVIKAKADAALDIALCDLGLPRVSNAGLPRDRRSGRVCRTSHGKEIIWNGHLCEGANLTAPIDDNFCLWTRCGKHDVPGLSPDLDDAHEGDIREVTCPECLNLWNEENGQFGVGA